LVAENPPDGALSPGRPADAPECRRRGYTAHIELLRDGTDAEQMVDVGLEDVLSHDRGLDEVDDQDDTLAVGLPAPGLSSFIAPSACAIARR
jgi:hypothetical protein